MKNYFTSSRKPEPNESEKIINSKNNCRLLPPKKQAYFQSHYDLKHKENLKVFSVLDDSMDNGLRSSICINDTVAARIINKGHWISALNIADFNFVIVHKNGIAIKRVVKHDFINRVIRCSSLNPIYDDVSFHMDEVIELYHMLSISDRIIPYI